MSAPPRCFHLPARLRSGARPDADLCRVVAGSEIGVVRREAAERRGGDAARQRRLRRLRGAARVRQRATSTRWCTSNAARMPTNRCSTASSIIPTRPSYAAAVPLDGGSSADRPVASRTCTRTAGRHRAPNLRHPWRSTQKARETHARGRRVVRPPGTHAVCSFCVTSARRPKSDSGGRYPAGLGAASRDVTTRACSTCSTPPMLRLEREPIEG